MSTAGARHPLARAALDVRGWTYYAIGALLLAAVFAVLGLDGRTVATLVEEDGLIEWAGALGLFAGAGAFLASFLVARRRGPASGKSQSGTWVLLAFAAGLFFFAGEEISWGQRLFGWGTPEALSEVNAQDETTFHNLQPFQGTTLDGDRLFRLGWIVMFVLVPLVAWLMPRWRKPLQRLLPVSPLWLAALFATAYLFTHLSVSVFDNGWNSIYAIGSAATEIQEAAVEVLMGVAAFVTLRTVRRDPSD